MKLFCASLMASVLLCSANVSAYQPEIINVEPANSFEVIGAASHSLNRVESDEIPLTQNKFTLANARISSASISFKSADGVEYQPYLHVQYNSTLPPNDSAAWGFDFDLQSHVLVAQDQRLYLQTRGESAGQKILFAKLKGRGVLSYWQMVDNFKFIVNKSGNSSRMTFDVRLVCQDCGHSSL